jgi:hypothetical protein
MYVFGDSFDLYAAPGDAVNGYWDANATLGTFYIVPGRFAGGQAIRIQQSGIPANALAKTSGSNDAVHHVTVAFQQSAAITGSTLGLYLAFYDGATAQCSIVFRSDGAILLTSGVAGTVLATYTGAFTIANQWFAFEFEVVINNTTGSFRVRTNNATSDSFVATSLNTRGGTANNYANKISITQNLGVSSQYYDDLLWRSDPASVPWVGDIRTYIRTPASDVSTQFSRLPAVTYGGAGSAQVSITINTANYQSIVPPINGSIGTVLVHPIATVNGNVKCAIYASSAGNPSTVIQSATAVMNAPTVGANYSFTFSPPVPVTAGTTYFLAICGDTSTGNCLSEMSVNPTFLFSGAATYSSWPVNNPPISIAGAIFWANYTLTPTTNSGMVSDVPQDGAATYVYDNNAGDNDLYAISTIPVTPASIVAVTARGFAQKSDAGSRTGALQMKSGSTTVQTPNGQTLTAGVWSSMWGAYLTDPATGAAWTPTGVNNLQIGPVVLS